MTRVRRADDGLSLVSLVLILAIVAILLASLARVSGHNLERSGENRELTRAFHAAEAGIAQARADIAADGCSDGYTNVPVTPSGQPTIGNYTVTITGNAGCPGSPPKSQTITSTGVSSVDSGDTKRLEYSARLFPRVGFNEAVFVNTSLDWQGGTITGNVFSNAAISLPYKTTINGDVLSPSSITTSAVDTINGDVFVGGPATLGGSTKVVGDVISATSPYALSLASGGSISGTAQSGGAITGGGSFGEQVPNSPSTAPATRVLPTFDVSAACSGLTQYTADDVEGIWSTNKDAMSGTFCVTQGSGTLDTPTGVTTLSGDLTILATGSNQIDVRGSIRASSSRRLVLVASSPEPNFAIRLRSSVRTITTNISTLLITPRNDLTNQGKLNIDYAGDLVGSLYAYRLEAKPLRSLTYTPTFVYNPPPGLTFTFTGDRYDVTGTFREISAS